MSWLLETILDRPLVRRLVNTGIAHYARRRVDWLDRHSAETLQQHVLTRLIRKARDTRFGRDHDFARIRSLDDYQRRVPLRDYESFWSQYWAADFPYLQGATWPGSIPYSALSSGTTSGTTKYIPISREMLASNQRAAMTALSLFMAARPGVPLFNGRLFFLGGSTDLVDLTAANPEKRPPVPGQRVLAGDLSGIASCEASAVLRPFAFPPTELALMSDWDRKLDLLASRAAHLKITMLSGVPSWILALFDRVKKVTGKDRITDIWPELRLVIHGGTRFDPYRALFKRELGDEVFLLDTYPASEGYVASEDPRYGLLRLLPDHDVFFEFVPVSELTSERPARHTVGQVEPGVQYAIAMTTCAGLWSYIPGDTICFERRDPPLLRFTGRTRYFLSAFGEHLISEEVERAIAAAAEDCGSAVVDFHVGPVFPESPSAPGRHRFFVEFSGSAPDPQSFAASVDRSLCTLNEDYRAHRLGDIALLAPEVQPVRCGGFADWMRSQGKLGGQHKVPRMDNTGQVTRQMTEFFTRTL